MGFACEGCHLFSKKSGINLTQMKHDCKIKKWRACPFKMAFGHGQAYVPRRARDNKQKGDSGYGSYAKCRKKI